MRRNSPISARCEDELTGRIFVREGDCWDLCEQIVPFRLDMGMVLGI